MEKRRAGFIGELIFQNRSSKSFIILSYSNGHCLLPPSIQHRKNLSLNSILINIEWNFLLFFFYFPDRSVPFHCSQSRFSIDKSTLYLSHTNSHPKLYNIYQWGASVACANNSIARISKIIIIILICDILKNYYYISKRKNTVETFE